MLICNTLRDPIAQPQLFFDVKFKCLLGDNIEGTHAFDTQLANIEQADLEIFSRRWFKESNMTIHCRYILPLTEVALTEAFSFWEQLSWNTIRSTHTLRDPLKESIISWKALQEGIQYLLTSFSSSSLYMWEKHLSSRNLSYN